MMNLVLHADGLREVDWLRDILGDTIEHEAMDLDLTWFQDNTIHVVSSNWRPLPTYEAYAQECRRCCRNSVLFHLSDEWLSGGYALYRHFDAVIRNFHTWLADSSGILTIPEGYANGTRAGGPIRPADQRRYAWMFTGELKASRLAMIAAFEGFQPRLLTATASISEPNGRKLSKAEFDAALGDTVFSPCPMGNAILETWRLYESLELGCIPLAERRVSLDYFTTLFGVNPIPSFRTWQDARRFAETLFADKPSMLGLQNEIHRWWTGHKAKVRAQVCALLEGPSHAAELQRFARLTRNRVPVLHEPLRLAELLRHQSPDSLRRRLARPGGPMKRIINDSLRHLR